MANHCSILALETPWTKKPGRLQSLGVIRESDMAWQLNNNNKDTVFSRAKNRQTLSSINDLGSVNSSFSAMTQTRGWCNAGLGPSVSSCWQERGKGKRYKDTHAICYALSIKSFIMSTSSNHKRNQLSAYQGSKIYPLQFLKEKLSDLEDKSQEISNLSNREGKRNEENEQNPKDL